MYKGTILDFKGNWFSGIAYLIIRRENGMIDIMPCENASTIRTLDFVFGNVITEGHCVNIESIRGRKVIYETDQLGLLEWLAPAEGGEDG